MPDQVKLKHAISDYPPIADYALIGDCHGSALISRAGSIDWCCMPRMDSPSVFGRLLDWNLGGYCSITPIDGDCNTFREYLDGTMVLETNFTSPGGACRVLDCFTMRSGGADTPHRELLRVVEGVRGKIDLEVNLVARFDYGEVRPWLRRAGERVHAAIGGNNGLVIACDTPLTAHGHDLSGRFSVRAGERVRLSILCRPPEEIDIGRLELEVGRLVDRRLEETVEWWRRWVGQARLEGPDSHSVRRSAMVLKAITYAPTGAVAAAPTTSLPERIGGSRNWDYRFSWIRDSSLSTRSLADIGLTKEADGFRRFIQRSAAGSATDLQIMYGLGGERRLTELELPKLEGYRGSKPVRIGNAASDQLQLDAYGDLMLLSWAWHRRGSSPDDDYWRFLVDLVETACTRWRDPDRGIWESRGKPLHFVHSKASCWAAVDRGVALAEECMRRAPVRRWKAAAREIRADIEEKGYDAKRGVFTQSYGRKALDSALLLLPSLGFVAHDDERMIRTADAIRAELMEDGLLLRYRTTQMSDGVGTDREGTFLSCTFWLAEVLAKQGRVEEAREAFDRVSATSNDLGLFAEEYDVRSQTMLGNFPQGLTHLSQIAAAVALTEVATAGIRTSQAADDSQS